MILPASAQQVKELSFSTDPTGAKVYKRDSEGDYHYVGVADGKKLKMSYSEKEKDGEMFFQFRVPQLGEDWSSEPIKVKGIDILKSPQYPESGSVTLPLSLWQKVQGEVLLHPLLTGLKILFIPILGFLGFRLLKRKGPSELPRKIEASIGETGTYEIKEMLGEGGMATVYRAISEEQEEEVAVKVLRSELSDDPESKERFRREIQVSIGLRHPNLMHLYDWGETSKKRLYFVCELLRGETLKERIVRERKLPEADALTVLREVAAGLDHLHEQHLVHRDVKPGNIFLCDNGKVKLVDLGIARGLDMAAVTQTGKAMGSPRYMSPEQIKGNIHLATDQYAMGILALELLSGTTLFSGSEPMEILYAHSQGQLPSFRSKLPEANAMVELVLKRMLSLKPDNRFPTVGEAITALERALSDLDGDATDDIEAL